MAFNRPTLSSLIQQAETEIESRLNLGPLLPTPGSVLRVLARTVAGMIHGLHGHLAHLARQIIPSTASSDNLDRWASLFLTTARKAATFATGTVRFTGTDTTSIPAGTDIQRADGLQYETLANATIASGIADVSVRAKTAGDEGDAATGVTADLVSPIAGVGTTATVQSPGITGGADQETDEQLLARLSERMKNPPQGVGADADYERFALEVAGVTRAWALENHLGLGTVGVTFAVDDDPAGPIPDAAKVTEVDTYLNDSRRAVTAALTTFAPTAVNLSPTITGLTPDTGDVRTAVTNALTDLLRDEAQPGGLLAVSKIRAAISNAAGEEDHVLTSPVADVQVQAGELLVLGTVTFA